MNINLLTMRFLCLLHCLLCFTLLYAQDKPIIDWELKCGNFWADAAHEVIQNMQGNIVMIGQSHTPFRKGEDGYLVILNKNGEILREKKLGYKKDDILYSIVETYDGGYVLAGYSDAAALSPQHIGKKDAWLVKTDEHGTVLWDKLLGTAENDVFYDVAQDQDGNLIATGHFGQQICLLKFSANGDKIWEQKYNSKAQEIGRALWLEKSGDIALTGYEKIDHKYQVVLLKTFPDGRQQWKKYFPQAKGVDIWKDEMGYWITGTNQSLQKRDNMYVLKTDRRGNKLSPYSYGGAFEDAAHTFLHTKNKEYFIAGYTYSHAKGAKRSQLWLHQIDKYGKAVWKDNFYLGGVQYDEANDLLELQDGSLLIAGMSSSKNTEHKDAWLIKMEAPPLAETTNTPTLTLSKLRFNNNKQQYLAPNERGYYIAELSNTSDTDAHQITAKVQLANGVYDIHHFPEIHIGDIATGQTQTISFPVQSGESLQTGQNLFSIKFQSANGLVMPAQQLSLESQTAPQPNLKIITHNFGTSEGNFFEKEQTIALNIEIENQGNQTAEGVQVVFSYPYKVKEKSKKTLNIGTLEANTRRQLKFEFEAEAVYLGDNMDIGCRVFENQYKYGTQKTFNLSFQKAIEPKIPIPENQEFITVTWVNPDPNKLSSPTIEWTLPEFEIEVKAKSSQALAKNDFSVLLNGQVQTGEKYGEESFPDNTTQAHTFTFKNKLVLQKGENKIYIKAKNKAGIDSTIQLIVNHFPEKGNLHILSIGVPYHNLKYTTKDAADFIQAFADSQAGYLYEKVYTQLLNTPETTKTQDIRDKVADLLINKKYKDKITEHDVVILFISAHGRYDKYDDIFRIIPSDYDGVHDTRTIDFKRDILAPLEQLGTKTLLFIDACQSGSIKGNKDMLDDAEASSAILQLLQAQKGVRTIMSCSANERSFEDVAWENGAFSEALLAALNNETVEVGKKRLKANQNEDYILNLDELFTFVKVYVPHLVKSVKKSAQHPYFPQASQGENLPFYFYKK